jgi:hypothetical protein
MEKLTSPSIVLIAFIVMTHMERAWAIDTSPSDDPVRSEMAAVSKETPTRCNTFTEQQPSTNGLMVAEDMHCRQCHGKCTADTLRCRSQCLNDTACLAHCEERSNRCTAMCKQVFQCADKPPETF